MDSAPSKVCHIDGCENSGNWESNFCPTCRAYIRRVSGLSVAWRIARLAQVQRWENRLELLIAKRKGITNVIKVSS